jgi:hypothetical protein
MALGMFLLQPNNSIQHVSHGFQDNAHGVLKLQGLIIFMSLNKSKSNKSMEAT